jgi:hypothetical protein
LHIILICSNNYLRGKWKEESGKWKGESGKGKGERGKGKFPLGAKIFSYINKEQRRSFI